MNDLFGFTPKFQIKSRTTHYFRLADALDDSRAVSLNYNALNVFFRLGMFLNGDTPFKEIKRVLPEAIIVSPIEISRERAIDTYIELFRASVKKNLTEKFAVAISGGADSRHILLELISQDRRPEYALTVAIPGRPTEVEIARNLCERLAIKQKIVQPRPERAVSDEVWKNLACDFMSLEHGWYSTVGQTRDMLPWWDGIAGDVLSAGLFLTNQRVKMFDEGRLDELAESMVSSGPIPLLGEQSRFPREAVLHILHMELVKHKNAANPVGSFYFWNRTRIAIGCSAFGLLRPTGQETIAPYLDEEVWRFLSSLPASMLVDQRFHVDAIHRAYPAYSDIEFFKTYEKESIKDLRRKSISLLRFLHQRRKIDSKAVDVALRAIRSMLFPSRASEINWILRYAIYWMQIEDIVGS